MARISTLRPDRGIPASTLLMMSAVAGLTVANLYYNQPLLEDIRTDLACSLQRSPRQPHHRGHPGRLRPRAPAHRPHGRYVVKAQDSADHHEHSSPHVGSHSRLAQHLDRTGGLARSRSMLGHPPDIHPDSRPVLGAGAQVPQHGLRPLGPAHCSPAYSEPGSSAAM